MKKNSKLTIDEVKKVARLAKLEIKSNEIEKFRAQLTEILKYFQILKKVKTDKVAPTSQVTGLVNISRADFTRTSLPVKEALSGSQSIHDGLFKTDIVLEKT